MKPIKKVKCVMPFTDLSIHTQGYCYSCYPEWTKIGNVGILNEQDSIMDIWNGEKLQKIREAVLEDKLEGVCNFEYCPHAMKKGYLDLESFKNHWDPKYIQIIEQIAAGKSVLETAPYTFAIANSGKCNLRCIMCTSNDQFIKNDDQLNEKLYGKLLPEILPKISKLHLGANGEVFFNPYAVKFLQSLKPTEAPSFKIQLSTNGTLFSPKLWETIKHNHYEYIGISIDAATKETYEKIRKNGNWDTLLQNLDFISGLRRQNVFSFFRIHFCVMKSNYQEMPKFVELGLKLGCDQIVFQKIYEDVAPGENINLTKNKQIFMEIGKILSDPIFKRPEVDTTLIDEYRKYNNVKVFLKDRILTIGKECQSYLRKKKFS